MAVNILLLALYLFLQNKILFSCFLCQKLNSQKLRPASGKALFFNPNIFISKFNKWSHDLFLELTYILSRIWHKIVLYKKQKSSWMLATSTCQVSTKRKKYILDSDKIQLAHLVLGTQNKRVRQELRYICYTFKTRNTFRRK